VAPSIGRWSTETATCITDRGRTLPFFVTTTSLRTAPTARMDDWGGFDDRRELLGAVHAEVGHRRGAAFQFVLVEPPFSRPLDEVTGRGRHHADRHVLNAAQHRRNQAAGRRHRSAKVHVGIILT